MRCFRLIFGILLIWSLGLAVDTVRQTGLNIVNAEIFGKAVPHSFRQGRQIHLVYTDQHAVYYLRSADAGLTWDKPRLIANGSASGAQIIGNAENRLYIFYTRDGGIYTVDSVDGGGSWSAPYKVSSVYNRSKNPCAVISGLGDIYVVWENNGVILCRRYDKDAAAWQNITDLSGGDSEAPLIVNYRNHALYAVWLEKGEVVCQPFDLARETREALEWVSAGANQKLGTVPANCRELAVAVDSQNNLHVVWSNGGQLLHRVRAAGLWSSTISRLTSNYISGLGSPSVAFDASGQVFIAYIEGNAATLCRYDARTRSWEKNTVFTLDSPKYFSSLTLGGNSSYNEQLPGYLRGFDIFWVEREPSNPSGTLAFNNRAESLETGRKIMPAADRIYIDSIPPSAPVLSLAVTSANYFYGTVGKDIKTILVNGRQDDALQIVAPGFWQYRHDLSGSQRKTVRLQAVDALQNRSPVAELMLEVDREPPQIFAVSHNAAGRTLHVRDELTVTLRGEPNGRAFFSISGLTQNIPLWDAGQDGDTRAKDGVYTGVYTVDSAQHSGQYSVTVSLSDAVGNLTEQSITESLMIDSRREPQRGNLLYVQPASENILTIAPPAPPDEIEDSPAREVSGAALMAPYIDLELTPPFLTRGSAQTIKILVPPELAVARAYVVWGRLNRALQTTKLQRSKDGVFSGEYKVPADLQLGEQQGLVFLQSQRGTVYKKPFYYRVLAPNNKPAQDLLTVQFFPHPLAPAKDIRVKALLPVSVKSKQVMLFLAAEQSKIISVLLTRGGAPAQHGYEIWEGVLSLPADTAAGEYFANIICKTEKGEFIKKKIKYSVHK
ncbi:MAG: exo-alpha-sialidase [Candidatus Margulisbacteria bacterium]|jgi:hypothetical protein|nr:exo-alpha-sialidase [Candidatus Margulisiibacteriota bacterium]